MGRLLNLDTKHSIGRNLDLLPLARRFTVPPKGFPFALIKFWFGAGERAHLAPARPRLLAPGRGPERKLRPLRREMAGVVSDLDSGNSYGM